MSRTNATAREATPKEKTDRLSDSLGLYLERSPNGGRYWRD